MDLYRRRLALLKIVLPTLFAVTWMFIAFVMDTRPAARPGGPIDRLARLPASLSSGTLIQPAARVTEPVRMSVFELPCWDQANAGENAVGARWVRLVGRNCRAGTILSVRNLTNANVATVLPEARGRVTTDYIPLEAGRNEILFTIQSAEGATIENRVTLVR